MRKILVVFGTRPEAVKMAPVVISLRQSLRFDVKVCVTAQHREMLDQVLEVFGIAAEFDLNLMNAGQDLTEITAKVLFGLREVFKQWKPDLVFVHGDTTTAMAASLAGFYEKIPIGHVEAGLRTEDIYSPWPEEMNRRLIGRIATFHFAPTNKARLNLLNEGCDKSRVFVTGNTVVDAILSTQKLIESSNTTSKILHSRFGLLFDAGKRPILVTAHRRENFGLNLRNVCFALIELSKRDDVLIIFPVHPNPKVHLVVHEMLAAKENIHLLPPQDYLSFIYLMLKSYFVITDSGGIQEEAPVLGKPVLVLRNNTERPEAVEAGTARLVGTSSARIIEESERLLSSPEAYFQMASAINPYGSGDASDRIVSVVAGFLAQHLD
jgi:UDP-N-acetylglucosamine 2-epimerase (non-hydrolysing)